jgi:esterase
MKLFYREFGEGEPVIILHGLLGLSDNWVSFGRRLGETRRVIIPDLRNHGQSPRSNEFNFSALTGDVRQLMEDLEIPHATLIGHSLGGKTAALLALETPELADRLVVVDISLRHYTGHSEHLDIINAMLETDIGTMHSRSELEKQLAHRVPSLRIRQFLMKSVYWKDREHLAWRLNLLPIKQNLPSIFEAISPELQYEKPVLFIRGGMSDYIVQEDIPEIKKHFPKARLETIYGASHWVHADAPKEFFRIVSEFLNI